MYEHPCSRTNLKQLAPAKCLLDKGTCTHTHSRSGEGLCGAGLPCHALSSDQDCVHAPCWEGSQAPTRQCACPQGARIHTVMCVQPRLLRGKCCPHYFN